MRFLRIITSISLLHLVSLLIPYANAANPFEEKSHFMEENSLGLQMARRMVLNYEQGKVPSLGYQLSSQVVKKQKTQRPTKEITRLKNYNSAF